VGTSWSERLSFKTKYDMAASSNAGRLIKTGFDHYVNF